MSTLAEANTAELLSRLKLSCPSCGDEHVSFNSRATVALRGKIEWAGIFICSDSHLFMMPLTGAGALGFREGVSSAGFDKLRIETVARLEKLRATVSRTKEMVRQNRAIRRHLLDIVISNTARRTGRPYGLPVQ